MDPTGTVIVFAGLHIPSCVFWINIPFTLHTSSSWTINKTQRHQHRSHNINKHAHTCTYDATSSQPANQPAIASITQSSPSFMRFWALWKAGAFAKRNDSSNSSGDVSGKFKDSMDVKPKSKPGRAALKGVSFSYFERIFGSGKRQSSLRCFELLTWQLQVQVMLPFRGPWRLLPQGPVVWHVSQLRLLTVEARRTCNWFGKCCNSKSNSVSPWNRETRLE